MSEQHPNNNNNNYTDNHHHQQQPPRQRSPQRGQRPPQLRPAHASYLQGPGAGYPSSAPVRFGQTPPHQQFQPGPGSAQSGYYQQHPSMPPQAGGPPQPYYYPQYGQQPPPPTGMHHQQPGYYDAGYGDYADEAELSQAFSSQLAFINPPPGGHQQPPLHQYQASAQPSFGASQGYRPAHRYSLPSQFGPNARPFYPGNQQQVQQPQSSFSTVGYGPTSPPQAYANQPSSSTAGYYDYQHQPQTQPIQGGSYHRPPAPSSQSGGGFSNHGGSSALDGMQFLWNSSSSDAQSGSGFGGRNSVSGPTSAQGQSSRYGMFSGLQRPMSLLDNQSQQSQRQPIGMRSPLLGLSPSLGSSKPAPRQDASALGSAVVSPPASDSTVSPTGSTAGSSSMAMVKYVPPPRPGVGAKGRSTRVRANFFEFLTLPGASGSSTIKELIQYDIKITPEVPPSLNRRVFREMVATNRVVRQSSAEEKRGSFDEALRYAAMVYDGRRNVYSPSRLELSGPPADQPEDQGTSSNAAPRKDKQPMSAETTTSSFDDATAGVVIEMEVTITDDPAKGQSSSSAPRQFHIRLREVGVINMQQLHSYLHSPVPLMAPPVDALQALDVIMRHRPSMMLTTVGRSFFSRNDAKVLGDGAECWMGYHQSVKPAKGRLLMNIDVSATAFYEPGPILGFLARNLGRKGLDDFRGPMRVREIEKSERLLRGVKVAVNHRGEIRRKYKVHGITRSASDQTFFKFTRFAEDGETVIEEKELSVEDYFKKQYNYVLKFPYLPCLKVGNPQKMVYLPMEVCDIVPGQRFLRKLNEQQTAQMIRLTCQTPDRRANKIAQAISELGLSGSQSSSLASLVGDDAEYLASFGVRVSDEMVTVPARILEPPTIQYHPSSREPLITPRDGSWNLRDKKVVQPATLHSWAVVCFGSPKEMPQAKVDLFLRELISTCRDTGLSISNPHPPALYGDPNSNIEATLQAAWHAAGESVQAYPQLILCILPNTGVPLYAEIKRVGDTVLGVPTQCVQVKHTIQPKKQYCANVCLKINSKLGGVNSFIAKNPNVIGDEGLPWVSDVPTMIFGADVTHPAHGENRTQGSVCALVGSLDRLASRYTATVRLQPPRREVIQQLCSMVAELLKIFYVENGNIVPQRILFYRDGVSESQLREVVTKEVAAIREACEQFQGGFNPTITYVAVQKRHHARVFATNARDADRSGNIPAGTVIDTHITHPNEFDFFLCSHAGLQGTSRPTHYHVLHDENGFSADMLHEFTYRLCYGYARCTRSVSVVPPAYYADLVAFRAKYHLKSAMLRHAESSVSPGGHGGQSADSRTIDSSSDMGQNDGQPLSPPTAAAAADALSDSASQRKRRSVSSRKGDLMSAEEEEELMKRLQSRLAAVKPELQKVMYFM